MALRRGLLLLLLLKNIATTHSASIPADIDHLPRAETTTGITSVEARQNTALNLIQDWRFQIATVVASGRGSVWGFQALARGCAEVKEQDTVGKKVFKAVWDCGIGAVVTIMLGGLAGANAVAVAQTAGPALKEYLMSVVHGRSLEELEKLGLDGAEHLSNAIDLEVRHLGNWNDTVTGAALRKRSMSGEPEGILRPVFGYTTPQGQDLHFSLVDRDETTSTIRVGFGHGKSGGSETALAERDIDTRAPADWFYGTGIDFKYLNRMVPPTGLNWHNDDMFAFLYDQLYCIMHTDYDFPHMEASQMYFQIVDPFMRGTRASMNVAVYGFDGHSGIEEMGDFKGSLYGDYRCVGYAN